MTPPPLPIGSLTLLPFLGCNCSLTAFPWWLTVRWPTAPKSSSCSRCGTFALVCSHCPPPVAKIPPSPCGPAANKGPLPAGRPVGLRQRQATPPAAANKAGGRRQLGRVGTMAYISCKPPPPTASHLLPSSSPSSHSPPPSPPSPPSPSSPSSPSSPPSPPSPSCTQRGRAAGHAAGDVLGHTDRLDRRVEGRCSRRREFGHFAAEPPLHPYWNTD